jgi:predicted nucleic acid-binding protein
LKIVDTVGWIAYLAGGTLADRYEEHLRRHEELVTPTIVLYEVFKYLLRELGEDAAYQGAGQVAKTRTIPLNNELATAAAEVAIRHGLPMADAIIYATAQSEGAVVATSDKHFRDLPGVEFIELER